MDLIQLAPLLLTALLALALGYLLGALRNRSSGGEVAAASHKSDLAGRDARLADGERQRRELQDDLAKLRAQLDDRSKSLGAVQAALDAERQQSADKLAELRGAREELKLQFQSLATEILEDKTKRFGEVNKEALGALLEPLQKDLTGFRQKVEEVYVNETKERSALAEQVRMLSELNGTLRDETTNLTRAHKGDSKAQGDWGEMILDRLLSNSGLLEGEHYTRQATQLNEEGSRVIPDVVLHLPQGRDFVVDSKVSLTAYSEYVAEPEGARKDELLQAHIASVKSHIKGLSEKNYQDLYKLTSVDFVLMFMPLEGAFMAAITTQRDLFQLAMDKNVLIVSPSTCLFVVRTIAHVWRQEAQSRNAIDIADRGAKLYDKFVAFTEDLNDIGEQLGKAQKSYDKARNKLTEGNGNLITQVRQLETLGVKAKKKLAPELLAAGDEEED